MQYHYELVTDEPNLHKCRHCQKEVKQVLTSGYKNLTSHLQRCTPNYVALYETSRATSPATLDGMGFVSTYALSVFGWMQFVIMTNQPFSAVEDPIVVAQSKYQRICVDTLLKYFLLVVQRVKATIAADLPDQFGIIFDGWSERSTHYLAIVAVYSSDKDGAATRIQRLLSLAPFEDETSFTARSHRAHLEFILSGYGKSSGNIVFLSGDNCSTNTALAKSMRLPLVGCASHRFNLAMKTILDTCKAVLDKVNTLMAELRTLKNAGRLRKIMHDAGLRPILPIRSNTTRWSSTFDMIQRYFKLKFYIGQIEEVEDFLLSKSEEKALTQALDMLMDFAATTKYLQGTDVSLADVRAVFDKTLDKYPHLVSLKTHLAPTASIVTAQAFENGVIKVIRGDENKLTTAEKAALLPFKIDPTTVAARTAITTTATTVVDEILSNKKKDKPKMYQDLTFIPPTSNSVERLFSVCRYLLPDNRKSMTPESLEQKLFLRVNSDLWDLTILKQIVNS